MTRRCDCGRFFNRCSRCDYDRDDEREESGCTMLFVVGCVPVLWLISVYFINVVG